MRTQVIFTALIYTVLIFAFAIALNYGMDILRIGEIGERIRQHDIANQAALAERSLFEVLGTDACPAMTGRLVELKELVRRVGEDLSRYSRFSWLKKREFEYLSHTYLLLQLELYALTLKLNRECEAGLIPALFFFEIEHEPSTRQGYILSDIAKEYEEQLIVISIDKDFDKEPLIPVLLKRYNVTSAPTAILGTARFPDETSFDALNATTHALLTLQTLNLQYTIRATRTNRTRLATELREQLPNAPSFSQGDILLVLSRLEQQPQLACEAKDRWKDALADADPDDIEQLAILHESLASLDCAARAAERAGNLRAAAQHWRDRGKNWRADILEALVNGAHPTLVFEPATIRPNLKPNANWRALLLGNSSMTLKKGDRVLVQSDRVTRDWLGAQLNQSPWSNRSEAFLSVFSERHTWPANELHPNIGWHEGGRARELARAGIEIIPAVGTLVARQTDSNRWYASDEQGIFRFEVPLDKLYYPATRFLTKDIAVIVDTHGVNMLVDHALSAQVSTVLSDCDHPAKVAAAAYLSDRNITVICLPDLYGWRALGHTLNLFTSPPFTRRANEVVVGNRPLQISRGEPMLVLNATTDVPALWYYGTPARYFAALSEALPTLSSQMHIYTFTEYGHMDRVVEAARTVKARILASRAYTEDDYRQLAVWLNERDTHKLILFHSASYPAGQRLYTEFPDQTTFGDVNPVILP